MSDSVLFIDYATTVKLLPVPDAMAICEDVFRMHARNSVKWSVPPSQKLDVGAPFHNHWHVKTVILEDEPIAGVRLYSYYDDGARNTVGRLDCARYIVLADPNTAKPLAILDEHWTYAIRSAAAAMVALKWLGPKAPRRLGLVGIGTMGENCLRCLRHLYRFDEIVCTSRRAGHPQTPLRQNGRSSSASRCAPLDTVEDVVRNADIAIGGTTRTDIVSREPWVQRGATFVSLARREMDPAGWAQFDKTVIDDWDCNMTVREFRDMIEAGRVRSRAASTPTSAKWLPAASPAASATTSAFCSTPPAWCRTTSASPGASISRHWSRGWESRCRLRWRSRRSAQRIEGPLRPNDSRSCGSSRAADRPPPRPVLGDGGADQPGAAMHLEAAHVGAAG